MYLRGLRVLSRCEKGESCGMDNGDWVHDVRIRRFPPTSQLAKRERLNRIPPRLPIHKSMHIRLPKHLIPPPQGLTTSGVARPHTTTSTSPTLVCSPGPPRVLSGAQPRYPPCVVMKRRRCELRSKHAYTSVTSCSAASGLMSSLKKASQGVSPRRKAVFAARNSDHRK